MASLHERNKLLTDALNEVWSALDAGDVAGAIKIIKAVGHNISGDEADEAGLRLELLGNRKRRSIPPEVRAYVCERDQWTCRICGAPVSPGDEHIDHVVPVHLGGDEGADNLRLTHARCNLQRRYEEFDWLTSEVA